MSPSERTMRARLAAHRRWANADPTQGTAAARSTFLARFEHEVDPDRVLSEQERLRRAEHARKAYFTGLALKSARARRLGRAQAGPPDAVRLGAESQRPAEEPCRDVDALRDDDGDAA